MSALDVRSAYRHCELVTRTRARNFYYGIRLLPSRKRSALCAVYTFAREVDDIGDGSLEPQDKLDRLAAARGELAELGPSVGSPRAAPVEASPVLIALADASARFPLPLEAFGELIDGVEMDVRGTSYPETATVLADRLGIAMQLTNILRDLREDTENGRVYLPKEELVRFGCDGDLVPASPVPAPSDRFVQLVSFQVERTRAYFAEGLRLLPMLDRRSAACVSAMAGIYRHLLDRIARRPEAVLEGRISLPVWQKAEIAFRSQVGLPP